MKALSVRQPWAWAIMHAGKDIENRTWKTNMRGVIAIHAPAKIIDEVDWPRGARKPKSANLIVSAIIGVVEIVDVVEKHRSKWFEGPPYYGWVLANPRRLKKPIPCKGSLGLWELSPNLVRRIRRQVRL
jgi:hypothetical protein